MKFIQEMIAKKRQSIPAEPEATDNLETGREDAPIAAPRRVRAADGAIRAERRPAADDDALTRDMIEALAAEADDDAPAFPGAIEEPIDSDMAAPEHELAAPEPPISDAAFDPADDEVADFDADPEPMSASIIPYKAGAPDREDMVEELSEEAAEFDDDETNLAAWEAAEETAKRRRSASTHGLRHPTFDVDGADTPDPFDTAPAEQPAPMDEPDGAATVLRSSQKKIWDLSPPQSGGTAPAAPAAPVAPVAPVVPPAAADAPAQAAPAAGGRRGGRVKTRLLGFNAGDDAEAQDVFQGAKAVVPASQAEFPVGWIVITEGPGRGTSFAIGDGVSQIGRGADQTIRLDFGDMSISRSNHAAIAYDAEQNGFFIGHGGKANLVRLNAAPVLSTETLSHGDVIRIGETTLRFVALCGSDFAWNNDESGRDDVARD
ncbi:MAG: FHA domain-containing protein [Pseudomonadota bacterium]